MADDLMKYHVQAVLLKTCAHHQCDGSSLSFTVGPTAVWAMKNLKKGALKLYPAGTVTKIKDHQSKGKLVAMAQGQCFAIAGYKVCTNFTSGKGVLDPFYWVKTTEDEEAVNMVLEQKMHDGVQLPCLTNKEAIKHGEQLLQLSGKVTASSGDGCKTAQPSAKKAKK